MPSALDTPDSVYFLPDNIPDNDQDQPLPGRPLSSVGNLLMPELIFGGGVLSNVYVSDDLLASDAPFRTVRLALRYGINVIDTSPYYGASEVLLGTILRGLADEFPRSSYRLMTKVGRYGPSDFDYSPQMIRRSVMRSLKRLNTTYLDVVHLHDVEFVASPVWPIPYCGDFEKAILDIQGRKDWGLLQDRAGKAWGTGDDKILAAIGELLKMKSEGLIKAIGMSGYPLPTLLRLSRLVANTQPYHPLDSLLSYSHNTLQNNRFEQYLPLFLAHGKVNQVLTASPLSMGLLTSAIPSWHPAPPDLKQAVNVAETASQIWPGGLPNLAMGFSFRRPKVKGDDISPYNDVPTIVGFTSTQHVHEAMAVWREVSTAGTNNVRPSKEEVVRTIFEAGGWLNWSWSSPPNRAFDLQGYDNLGRRIRVEI